MWQPPAQSTGQAVRDTNRTVAHTNHARQETQKDMNDFEISIDMIRPVQADSLGEAMAIMVVKLRTPYQHPMPCGAHDIEMTLRLEPADSIEALLQSAHTQMPEILREAARQIQARPKLLAPGE